MHDEEVHESDAEVMQQDAPTMVTVPVSVEGPVQVQTLPSRGGGEAFPISLADGAVARKILNEDPMRRSAVILSNDYDIYVSTSQAGCTATSGALWPNGIPLPWNAVNELWAMAAESGHASVLTVLSERWAE